MISDLPFLAWASPSFLVLLSSAGAEPATRHARPTRSTQVTQQRFMMTLQEVEETQQRFSKLVPRPLNPAVSESLEKQGWACRCAAGSHAHASFCSASSGTTYGVGVAHNVDTN